MLARSRSWLPSGLFIYKCIYRYIGSVGGHSLCSTPMEHPNSKKSFGQLLAKKTAVVDANKTQGNMDSGTANRLRKLLHRRKPQSPVVQSAVQCRIPGHYVDSRATPAAGLIRNSVASPAVSTLHINERYIRYDINTKPLVVVLAISLVFLGCLVVLKDIILQSSQSIVSVVKWKIIGAPFAGSPQTGLLVGLLGTLFSPLSVVSSWLSFIF
ncbi:uncharacterized protein DI49_4684 [Saccharomyces eubayanus]|uniref:uncharacterized protein n=1 Tax=Saccharomyces eubayanus TaxID=1080349 RepID=UPI0006C5CD7A|nr:hypothetical protein DI49_4684 [Saccharomyces eubayanus]KOG97109.1 hypothetical protein DI49_4684 [Saccharomyces eubayanus]